MSDAPGEWCVQQEMGNEGWGMGEIGNRGTFGRRLQIAGVPVAIEGLVRSEPDTLHRACFLEPDRIIYSATSGGFSRCSHADSTFLRTNFHLKLQIVEKTRTYLLFILISLPLEMYNYRLKMRQGSAKPGREFSGLQSTLLS